MMENLKGIDSPMFDFVEQTAGKLRPKDLEEIKKQNSHGDQFIEIIPEDGKEEEMLFDPKEDFSTLNSVNFLL
jgi:hypothetical protein